MPNQTLKQYIQRTSDEELKNIDNMISVEMGRRSLKIQADLFGFDFDKIAYFMNWSLFNEEQLSTILHNVIEELNRQKAKRQNVDVDFWDSDGNYKEDIQEINETDEWANSKNDKTTSCSELLSEIGLYTISKENGKTTKFY
nr:MAG TPA: hypothetical protein [Caudoviricetes sp.]